ncbi:MAG: hypothetical protein AAGF31_09745 [Planctomycetota bacterium]
MAKKRPQRRRPNSGKRSGRGGGKGRAPAVSVRKLSSGNGWVLVHPRCAVDRTEDLEEVRLMIDGGEHEVAIEELRWLLSGCSDMMAAHVLLGDLAIENFGAEPDVDLARGHYGYAYELGDKALRHAKITGPLPASQPANRPLHEAARGLAWCVEELRHRAVADEIAARVREWDRADPLGVAAMIDLLRSGGRPVIGLSMNKNH